MSNKVRGIIKKKQGKQGEQGFRFGDSMTKK